jgi:D-aspartate ligase
MNGRHVESEWAHSVPALAQEDKANFLGRIEDTICFLAGTVIFAVSIFLYTVVIVILEFDPGKAQSADRNDGNRPTGAQRRIPETLGALVLGGDYGALGIVRSLGRHEIPVWTLVDKYKLAGFSRYSLRTLQWPDHLDEAQQVEFLLDLSKRNGLDGWVLFPIGDEHAALLARHRDLLVRRFRVTTPCWEVMRWAYDKRLTYRLAANLGLSHPRTFCPRNRQELATLECSFPVILKPAFRRDINKFTRAKAWLVKDRNELIKRYDQASRLIDSELIMVQDLIEGGGENQFSYAGLYLDGEPLASLVARRTRQYPIDFGRASSFVETIEQTEIEEAAKRFLQAIRYTGVAEVEFKYDPRDQTYKLLEINARIWAWHTLGGSAGVDFPYLLWQCMRNETGAEIHARPGVKWLHLALDVPAAVGELWRGRIPPWSYLRSLSGVSEYAVLAKDDPLPAICEIPLMLASRVAPRIARNNGSVPSVVRD